MLKKLIVAAVAIAAPIMIARAQFQLDPNNMTPEQQEMTQQMQEMSQQVQQAIQDKGLDPQELFAPMQQSMLNGGDPMEAMTQILIDKGLMTPDQLTRMFSTMGRLALATIRQQLGSTDEEWAIVQAKLMRVVVAMSDAESDQFGRLTGRFIGGTSNSPMEKARKELKAALADPNISTERLHIVVNNWRREHEMAKAELAAARADLINILTLRQEGILLSIGVL